MGDNRLDLDANLIGYWGFDESLETDEARDATVGAHHLTVTASPSTQDGRVGNSRQFDGSTSFAVPVGSSTAFQIVGDMAVGVWAQLDSFNGGGSLARTLASCATTVTGTNNTMLWAVYVTNDGRVNYRHESIPSGEVLVRSPAGIIKTSQPYFIVVRRFASGPDQVVELVVDNQVLATEVFVGGSPASFPVPVPSTNAVTVLQVGRSDRFADSGFWHGWIDELSVHDSGRSYQPYFRSAYYRVSLRNATTRLTSPNNVLAVSSADMGSGVRWWCYERDQDLYVVKESPLGYFGPDTRLTTPGGGASTGAGSAELIYDASTDTLLVLFVAGNRIYKLTAQAVDAPATINMPFTADAGSIVKALDNAEGTRLGGGGGQRPLRPEDITYVNRTPIKVAGEDTPAFGLGNGGGQQPSEKSTSTFAPSLNFMDLPAPDGFGVAMGPRDSAQRGFRVFRHAGGGNTPLGVAAYFATGGFFHRAVTPVSGDVFYAEALLGGVPTGIFTNAVVWRGLEPLLIGASIVLGREGDGTETNNTGSGGGQRPVTIEDITYVNRTPVKISGQDAPAFEFGNGGGQQGGVTTSGSNRPSGLPIEVQL